MKETGSDHYLLPEQEGIDNDEYGPTDKKSRNIEGKGKVKWYEMINYAKLIPHLPVLKNIRGSKVKIQLWMFAEIDNVCQSIFEHNKSSFRYRAQIDIMCYYIGVKFVEQLFISNKGFCKDELSLLLESQEVEFRNYDRMKIIKEKFKSYVEKFYEGFIAEDEIMAHYDAFLRVFPDKKSKEKIGKIMDELLGNKEIGLAKERLRKRSEYAEYKNRKKIRVVE
jgi:uncharacterized protein YktA (UPF0223 family)